ncbi:MAG: UvrD-helicase domain-containing protein [Thermoanaerobaculales bacterium]
MSTGTLDPTRAADQAAREAAQRVFDRPLIIEAGAGTGKTATLVARILAWCLGPGWERAAGELAAEDRRGKPEPPGMERVASAVLDGVVAITFTEAAAAEMATRVGEALAGVHKGVVPEGFAAAPGVDAEVEGVRAGALLVALDHLTVSTIHAFCRRLLAASPLEAGLHPAFTVDADGAELAAVVDEVVERQQREAFAVEPDAHLLALAEAGRDLQEVAETVVRLATRGFSETALERDPFTTEAMTALGGELLAAIAEFTAAGGDRLRLARGTRKPTEVLDALAATAVEAHGLDPTALESLDRLCDWLRATWIDTGLLKRLREWSKAKFGPREVDALGEVADAVAKVTGSLERRLRALCDLQPVLLDHARRVVAPLLAAARRELRERGIESFDDLLRDARDLLVGHREVAARVRRGIRQLLVDEFQDTDRLQCEILRVLALAGDESRPCLFLVGDPKQSIFGWRDADLGAYEAFVAQVRDAGGEKHLLSVSFRSVPAILGEVSRCVRPVMAEEAGVQPGFQPLLPSVQNEGKVGFDRGRWGPVEMWVAWDDAGNGNDGSTRAGDATAIEAAALAADLRALHDEAGVPWREVGVLLRTSSDLDEYLQALREADVPYLVERDRSYYQRREVIDAVALVRAILDPADHLALVAWLRSAAVGVPDAAWIPLWSRGFPALVTALARPDAAQLEEVQAVVENVCTALPSDSPGLDRIAGWEHNLIAAVWHLAALREAFEREPAAPFVERVRRLTLIEATEAARTLGAFRVANLERFFRELLAAIEASAGDPRAVLRALREATAERREAEEARPRGTVEDAVRVMTLHKAKGLDFDHVYLMQTHKTTEGHRRVASEAREMDGRIEYTLLGAPTPGWAAVEERRERIAEAERVRTLYVALTRAKQRLVVSGNWHGQHDGGSHVQLLYQREGGAPDREELVGLRARARAGATSFVDDLGARWVFPALRGAEPAAARGPRDTAWLPSAAEIAAQAARLASLRADAEVRMERPFSAPASAEAHRLLRLELAAERLGGGEEEGEPRLNRHDGRIAMAVGAAVHRALEMLELGTDLDAALGRERGRLAFTLAEVLGEEERGEALERAGAVLDRLRGSTILARLGEIAPGVVARELPVLLAASDDRDAPVGFVAGAIDLVYRDPLDGGLVIADYKTDEVSGEAEIAARAAVYAPQGAAYRRALQQALGLATPPRFELWFLRADRIVGL